MSSQLAIQTNEVLHAIDLLNDMFPSSDSDFVTGLIKDHEALKAQMIAIANMVSNLGSSAAISHFIEANSRDYSRHIFNPKDLFNLEPAIKNLDAKFWQQAMVLSGIYEIMPEKRRDDWYRAIENKTTPEFTEATVRLTIDDLMASRPQFLAERVDYLFKNLSRNHKTNKAFGFSSRMILEYVFDQYGYSNHGRSGVIHDLRTLIAMFIGRDPPTHSMSGVLLNHARRDTGTWFDVDGGTMRIRAYMKGTVHIEVSEDVAWRLNAVLAMLNPNMIPTDLRSPPPKKKKQHSLLSSIIPVQVLDVLASMRFTRDKDGMYSAFSLQENKGLRTGVQEVISALGGVVTAHSASFSFDPAKAIREVVVSGLIPNFKSYQFYPTPDELAKVCVDLAEIEEGDCVLEPSAGLGGLAQFMPANTTLIEISELHCRVLREKGFKTVIQGDFLEIAQKQASEGVRYQSVVMNPPYSEGRHKSHLEAAATLVADNGRITAILPTSANGKDLLPGFKATYFGPYENHFANTSIAVVIGRFDKCDQ